jgi:hypothetical protein
MQWSSTWGTRNPGDTLRQLAGTGKKRGGKKTCINQYKHRNRLNLEPDLIFTLTNIRPRIEVIACQKEAQPSLYRSDPQ